jgi:hypothetical protein
MEWLGMEEVSFGMTGLALNEGMRKEGFGLSGMA